MFQVSWIRHRDTHILTFGEYTYSGDTRFSAERSENGTVDDWILHIKHVQKKDTGKYECQVSTEPIQSYYVYLDVLGKYMLLHHKSGARKYH